MEKKLKALFELQRFSGNKRLASMIAEAEKSLNCELDDDALSYVSAAGDSSVVPGEEDETDDT